MKGFSTLNLSAHLKPNNNKFFYYIGVCGLFIFSISVSIHQFILKNNYQAQMAPTTYEINGNENVV